MDAEQLKPQTWYWVRRSDGSLTPYRFHQGAKRNGIACGEFYVGSMLQTISLSRVVGEAQMPDVPR